MNPEITTASVNTTASVVVSGQGGKVRLSGSGVRFGDANVIAGNADTHMDVSQVLEFRAPFEIYAVVAVGTATAKIERWF